MLLLFCAFFVQGFAWLAWQTVRELWQRPFNVADTILILAFGSIYGGIAAFFFWIGHRAIKKKLNT
jgi:hypothetical protein